MALYKSAQISYSDDSNSAKDEVILYEDAPSNEDMVEVHMPSFKPQMVIEEEFMVPELPGSELPLEVVENEHAAEEAKAKEDENKAEEGKPKDPDDLNSYEGNVREWAKYKLSKVPKHRGEFLGLTRARAFMHDAIAKMDRAVSNDLEGKIDIAELEKIRMEMEAAADRLGQAAKLKSRKRANDEQDGIVKEARTPFPNAMVVSVPILLSTIARSIINGVVSQGKDVADLYQQHVKKFSLDLRDRASLLQHLDDCGYPMGIRDRLVMDDEELEVNSPKELASLYYA